MHALVSSAHEKGQSNAGQVRGDEGNIYEILTAWFSMLRADQQRRRLQRRKRHHPSWIAFDNDIRSYECQLLDISADGAKLIADIDASIGTTFLLSAVPHAVVRRRCEIVWRKGRTIGVKFHP
jgi:PilZ domain